MSRRTTLRLERIVAGCTSFSNPRAALRRRGARRGRHGGGVGAASVWRGNGIAAALQQLEIGAGAALQRREAAWGGLGAPLRRLAVGVAAAWSVVGRMRTHH